MGGDVCEPTIVVPIPEVLPVLVREVGLHLVAPGNVMAAVVRGQVDAICLMIGGNDDAADVEDGMLAYILLVAPDDVGWSSRVEFQMLIEGVTIPVTEIAAFADAQDHALDEAVEAAEQLHGCDVFEIPWPDGVLQGL